MMRTRLLTVVILISLSRTHGASHTSSPPPYSISWERNQYGMLTHQSLQSLLVSLEERVRGLDNFKSTIARWEFTLETLTRRIDALEAWVTRSQTAIQLKLDTVSQTIVSSGFKDDFEKDQLGRKLDAFQERFMHKIGYVETRLDAAISKLQGTVETGFVKMDNKNVEIGNELAKIGSRFDEIESNALKLEDRLNHTLKTTVQHAQNSHTKASSNCHMDKVTHMLYNIQESLNKTSSLQSQNDGPNRTNNKDQDEVGKVVANLVKSNIISEAQKIGNKVNNMYDDLWKKILSLEDVMRSSKLTKADLQEELRTFLGSSRELEDNQSYIVVAVDDLSSMIHKRINELGRKVDHSFQRIQTTQDIFLESCHRLQEDEPQLATKVSLILEKIVDTIINRTSNTDKQLVEVMEAIKGHNSQIIRTIGDSTKKIASLAEESNRDYKMLTEELYNLGGKTDDIAYRLQDFQDQTLEIHNETISKCFSNSFASEEESDNSTDRFEDLFGERTIARDSTENLDTVHQSPFETNYNQDVSKIFTELDEQESYEHEGDNAKNEGNELQRPQSFLKRVAVGNVNAIITEPNKRYEWDRTSNITNHSANEEHETKTPLTEKKSSINYNDKFGPEIIKSYSTEVKLGESEIHDIKDEQEARRLMILYIKVLRSHLSKQMFLREANPDSPYSTIEDLIKSVKRNRFIPRDFLLYLESWEEDYEDNDYEE